MRRPESVKVEQVSDSPVDRALRRRGLLLPGGFRADRRAWSKLRRRVFTNPPTVRNGLWQNDFSEVDTAGGGIWRIRAVIGYVTKYCLAITVTPTATGGDGDALDIEVRPCRHTVNSVPS